MSAKIKLSFVLICLFTNFIFAADGILPGSGSNSDPYLIEDIIDLESFGNPTNSRLYWADGVFTSLACNLDLSSRSYTNALIASDNNNPYNGYFKGNKYTISNLTISAGTNSYVGLFGYIGPDGEVYRLNIQNAVISGGNYTGGICGKSESYQIGYCNVSGSISGDDYVGGISGYVSSSYGNSPSVYECQSNCSISGNENIGGICGYFIGKDHNRIEICTSSCSVSGNEKIGGLCGYLNYAYIISCCSSGFISGNKNIGGISGIIVNSTIDNSYTDSNVLGTRNVAGITGQIYFSDIYNSYSVGTVSGDEYVGGIVGTDVHYDICIEWIASSTLENCYSASSITCSGTEYGGVCGRAFTPDVDWSTTTAVFWDSEASGVNICRRGIGKTTVQMYDIDTFLSAGWDIVEALGHKGYSKWLMPAIGYPVLGWQKGSPYITNDGIVDLNDFSYFAPGWMADINDPNSCKDYSTIIDFDGSGIIDINDLAIFCDFWLAGYISPISKPHAHWTFDETYGSIAHDFSGNYFDGTLYNYDPNDPNSIWSPGQIYNCLNFDGINDYIEIDGYPGISSSQSRTVAAWIKADEDLANIDNTFHSIISWGNTEIHKKWALVLDSTTGQLALNIWGAKLIGGPDLEDGQWHHIAVVLPDDANNINQVIIYIDGEKVASNAASLDAVINTNSNENVLIGATDENPDTGIQLAEHLFKGSIDDTRIYESALSASDIANLKDLTQYWLEGL